MRHPIHVAALGSLMALWAFCAAAQPSILERVQTLVEQVKRDGRLKLEPTTTQSVIDSAASELRRLGTPAIGASISAEVADAIASRQIAKDGGGFSNPRFRFSRQSIDATLDYAGTLSMPIIGAVDVRVRVHALLAPAVTFLATPPNDELRVRLAATSLEFSDVHLSRGGQPLAEVANDSAELLVTGVLLPARSLLDHVEFHLPTVIAADVALKPQERDGFSVSFEPTTLRPEVAIGAVSLLIDGDRLTALAQDVAHSGAPEPEQTGADFAAFRKDFVRTIAAAGADRIEQGSIASYVSTALADRLLSSTLASAPVCMDVVARDIPVPVHEKLTLPPVSSIDCTPERECGQTEDCAQQTSCPTVCTLRAPVTGHCITHGHDVTCEARKSAAKAACEAGKAARKGTCEATKAAEKGSCEALKGGYGALRGTGPDFAEIDSGDLKAGGTARVCLNSVSLDPGGTRLRGKLQIFGSASLSGTISFTPMNVLGHGTCFAAFSHTFSETAALPAQAVDVDAAIDWRSEPNRIAMRTKVDDDLHLVLPFRDIAQRLSGNPQFMAVCPLPGVATALRGLTPDNWWPKVAQGKLDRAVPSLALNVDLLEKPVSVAGLVLDGTLERTGSGIVGVFTTEPDENAR